MTTPEKKREYSLRYYLNGGKEKNDAWRKANWDRLRMRANVLRKLKGRKDRATPEAKARYNAKRRADRAAMATTLSPVAKMVPVTPSSDQRATHARQRMANWMRINREAQNEKRRQYLRINASARIARNLRSRISMAVAKKSGRFLDQVGCSMERLMTHLEARFVDGMTWSNYGIKGWHIDHIRPCSSFDLTDPEQQRECFHYSNLQPLWAEENLRKGDRHDGCWEKPRSRTNIKAVIRILP